MSRWLIEDYLQNKINNSAYSFRWKDRFSESFSYHNIAQLPTLRAWKAMQHFCCLFLCPLPSRNKNIHKFQISVFEAIIQQYFILDLQQISAHYRNGIKILIIAWKLNIKRYRRINKSIFFLSFSLLRWYCTWYKELHVVGLCVFIFYDMIW